MENPYILYSKMQTNYKKYKKGGAGANYAYRCFVAAAQELMEQDGPNPFDPAPKSVASAKVMGVIDDPKKTGKKVVKQNDESGTGE